MQGNPPQPKLRKDTMSVRVLKKTCNKTIESNLGGTLNSHELTALSQFSTLIELPEGKRFVTEGTVGQEAVVIIEGIASVMRGGEQIALASKGDFLGELSLLFNTPRNATLVTETPVVLAVLDRREFHSLLNACPRLKGIVESNAKERSA